MNQDTKGYAFVRFLERRDAEDAMDSLDGRKYHGREIRIELARSSRSSSRDRSRDRRDRSRSGGGDRRRERSEDRGRRDSRDNR